MDLRCARRFTASGGAGAWRSWLLICRAISLIVGPVDKGVPLGAVHLAQDRQRPRVQHPGQLGVAARIEAAATVRPSSTVSDLSGPKPSLSPGRPANGTRIRLSSNVGARALAISCGYKHSPVKEQVR
jgi:hypothetical protein